MAHEEGTTQPADAGPVERPVRPLVERLRSRHEFVSMDGGSRWYMSSHSDRDCAEAADEIERLRAELELATRMRQPRWHDTGPHN